MGIDPGTNYMGYGVLEIDGRSVRSVVLGDIDLHKLSDPYVKLRYIFERVGALIDQYAPREVALESPFFGENVQSMLKLGRAQGVAMAAALCRDGELLAQSYERTGLTHSRTLLPMIENMLSNTETPKDAIDMVAVAQGPGSFTGIRIGVAAAKGLAFAADKPAVGVSTLEAMARNVAHVPGLVICAMDARRQQIYNALFEADAEGQLTLSLIHISEPTRP